MNIDPQEVISLMQQRFPQEFEIVVLTLQNQKLTAASWEESNDEEN